MSEETPEYRKAVSEAPVEWDELIEKEQQARRLREIRKKNGC